MKPVIYDRLGSSLCIKAGFSFIPLLLHAISIQC